MIECKFANQISAYHDGELDEPFRAEMEGHLSDCPLCKAELARLERLSLLVRTAGWPEMSQETMEHLHQSVSLLPQAGLWHMAEAFAVAAAAILLLSSIWLWRISTDREAAGQIQDWETLAVAPQESNLMASQEQWRSG